MFKYIYLILLSFCTGCIIEDSTGYQGYIKNATVHQIKILPFYNGTIRNTQFTLMPGDSIRIASGIDRGMVNHAGFYSEILYGDSVIVIFDNLYPISHHVFTPASLRNEHYLYSSLRNLGNYKSWEYSFKDFSRHRREAFYLYRFTEQDYLDAK